MSRYNTRFQARKAAQPQVPQVPSRVPQQQVPSQVPQPYFPKEDVDFLKDRLDRSDNLKGMGEQIINALEIFSYLAVHQSLLHHPRFRESVAFKISHLRQQLEDNKKTALNTFVRIYSPHTNSDLDHRLLMEARDVLSYAPQLEEEFKRVETVMY